jgi:hypothetical protein
MSDQREELARDIIAASSEDTPLPDSLIAKGWRKFRTATTKAELDALPNGAIIMSLAGRIHQHTPTGGRFQWRSIDGTLTTTERLARQAPHIVLNPTGRTS